MNRYQFSEVITDITSKFNKIKASDYKNEGRFKIIDQGQSAIAGYTDEESLVNTTHSPIIIFGDHTRVLKYEDTPIALGADGAKALAVNPKMANTLYVYYFLRSINLKAAGYSRHFKFLKQVTIPIPEKDGKPNLDEQKRIAHLLGKVEGMIARRKQHLQQLDELLKSVFLEMFGDLLHTSSRMDIYNSEGWSICTVGDQITLQRGKDITQKNAKVGSIPVISSGGISFFHNETFVKGPGVLLGRKGSVGKVHYSNVNYWPHDTTLYVKDFKNNTPLFVYFYFKLFPISNYEASAANPSLNRNNLHPVKTIWPPINLQNQFATIVTKVESLKSRYQSSLSNLENLYGALSQKAFKGELDLGRVVLPVAGKIVMEAL